MGNRREFLCGLVAVAAAGIFVLKTTTNGATGNPLFSGLPEWVLKRIPDGFAYSYSGNYVDDWTVLNGNNIEWPKEGCWILYQRGRETGDGWLLTDMLYANRDRAAVHLAGPHGFMSVVSPYWRVA